MAEGPAGPWKKRPSIDWDDVDVKGHLNLEKDALLNKRYQVDEALGCGTFGQVWKVTDVKTGLGFAMKVSVTDYEEGEKFDRFCMQQQQPVISGYKYANSEVGALKRLNSLCPPHKGLIVKMYDHFVIYDRVFIILELLSQSIYDFLEGNHFQPFQAPQAIQISKQILEAVDFLHSNSIMHTDIKPENIVFVNSEYTEIANNRSSCRGFLREKERSWPTTRILKKTDIRIIDLGSNIDLRDKRIPLNFKISTREYRSPESILRLMWGPPADVWSVGCTIFDIWNGFTIFNHVFKDVQQLMRMETVLGPLPKHFLKVAPPDFLKYREVCKNKGLRGWEKPWDPLPPNFLPMPSRLFNYFDHEDVLRHQAYLLIQSLLAYDPGQRLTASQALKHSLFHMLKD